VKAKVTYDKKSFSEAFMRKERPIAKAATLAIFEAADDLKGTARASIAGAGFSKKWQNALRVEAYPKRGKQSINAAALIYHKISYASIFEDGANISGKPTLWLPMPNIPKKLNGKKLSPKTFKGPLQYVKRPGKRPLLVTPIRVTASMAKKPRMGKIAAARLNRGPNGAGVIRSVPVFFGINTVRIRKRFDIGGATKKVGNTLGALYFKKLKVDE
jgi:hypothetical protein